MTVQNDEVTDINLDDDAGLPEVGTDRGDNFNPEGAAEPEKMDAEALAEIAGQQEGEDDAAAQAAGRMIPKARFDEVNNAKKQAEQENARLLAQIEALRVGAPAESQPGEQVAAPAAEQSPEVSELERQRIDALMDGDIEEAVKIGSQINAMLRSQAKADALQEIADRNAQQTAEQGINEAAASVIAKYPAFDDGSAQVNTEAIAELVELRDYYINAKGMNPAEAITRAGEKVAAMFGFTATQEAGQPVDPRTKGAIERGASVTASQPNTNAVGVGTRQDAARLNINTMSDEQFEALPEAEKRRLRGD